MEENIEPLANRYIAVKTPEVEYVDDILLLGECLFAVDRDEWYGFQKYITEKELLVYSSEDKEINIVPLYYGAKTFEVDEKTSMFLLLHGTNKALKYIRKGIVIPRNRLNLYNIFNILALFGVIEKLQNDYVVIDCVSISKGNYYGIEKDPTVLAWKLPSCQNEIESCKAINEKLMEEALSANRNSLRSILRANKFWCDLCISNRHIDFKLIVPDDVCLWNPEVFVELKHNDNIGYLSPYNWTAPPIYNKKKTSLHYFINDFLPSLTTENYQEKLTLFFST